MANRTADAGARNGPAGQDEMSGGRLDPGALVVNVSVGASGFDDGRGVGTDALGFLDDVLESEAEIRLAARKEAEGVSVAIDGGAVGQAEFLDEPNDVAPLEKGFLDGGAIAMLADGAAAAMLSEVERGAGGGRRSARLDAGGKVGDGDGGHSGDVVCRGDGAGFGAFHDNGGRIGGGFSGLNVGAADGGRDGVNLVKAFGDGHFFSPEIVRPRGDGDEAPKAARPWEEASRGIRGGKWNAGTVIGLAC